MAPLYKKIPRYRLKPGMIVRTPATFVDEDGKTRPWTSMWPDAPAELRVVLWDWEGGETDLRAIHGKGSVDLNVLDYPRTFEVLATSIPKRKRKNTPRR